MHEAFRAQTSGNVTPIMDASRIQQSYGDALSSGQVYQDAQALNKQLAAQMPSDRPKTHQNSRGVRGSKIVTMNDHEAMTADDA